MVQQCKDDETMSRATQILEDVQRQTGRTMYRCINNKCGAVEVSSDLTPSDAMKGIGAQCAACGSKTEAISGHSSLPGYTSGMSSRAGNMPGGPVSA